MLGTFALPRLVLLQAVGHVRVCRQRRIRRARNPPARGQAVAAVALTPFLIAEAGVALEIDLATLTDPARNPGFDLAALALAPSAGPAAPLGAAPLGDAGRFALLQGERLRRVLIQASERDDPVAPARFLARLAQARRDGEIGPEADAVLQPQVRAAMIACGLLPGLQA